MRILLALILGFVVSGCAMQQTVPVSGSQLGIERSSVGENDRGSGPAAEAKPRWVSLVEGSDLAYDAHDLAEKQARYGDDFSEMVLNNGARLRGDSWDDYLKDFILSLPQDNRHQLLDGITRHFHQYDRVENAIRFEPLRLLSGPYARTSHVALRGIIKDDAAHAVLRIRYYGRNWIFAERLTIVLDNERISLDSLQFARDHSAGNVWEYVNLPLSREEYRELSEKISESESVIIRFHGRQYYSDLEVTERMKEDLRAMVNAVSTLNRW